MIQHILEHGDREHRAMIIGVLTRDFFAMSLDQYASKVVEKGLKIAAKKDLHVLIDQVLVPGDNKHHGRPRILDMMNHQVR